tara:strand:- start:138 stop:704 length:567 start_codon:yes stop_codon:yes gene_type:complete
MKMKDYYDILKVPTDASSLKIFKEFKKRFLERNLDLSTKELVLTSYLVLQDTSRKFYDIALNQYRNKKTINPKYLAVVEKKEKKAKELFEQQKDRPEVITKPLKNYPLDDSGLEFFGLLMEVNYGWVAIGIFLILAAMVTTGYYLSNGDWTVLIVSLPVMTIGLLSHNHGIVKFKKEKIEKITAHNNK